MAQRSSKIAMAMHVKNESAIYLKDLRLTLGEKWLAHRTKIERIWKAMNKKQREEVIRAGASDGAVLLTHTDQSMGDVHKVIPEWNLRDLTRPGPNYLLDVMKFRATTPLCQQYKQVLGTGPGDEAFIAGSMRINGLKHGPKPTDTFTVFWSEDEYGDSYDTEPGKYSEVMDVLSMAIQDGTCVHKSMGELILKRQIYFMRTLVILLSDILCYEFTPHGRVKLKSEFKLKADTPESAARQVMARLSIEEQKPKFSVAAMVGLAADLRSDVEDYLRPGLVPDEMGRTASAATHKDINAAVFEVLHHAVTGISIWGYVMELLGYLLKESTDRVYKGIILQELSNVFNFEYRRTQNVFKRFLQAGTGAKHFKRISGATDEGQARIKMKGKPDTLAGKDTQMSCLLHFCQPETDSGRAVDWAINLDKIHDTKPTECKDLRDSERDAFHDLITTTSFMQCLSQAVALPTPSPRKGQTYLSRFKALGAELGALKEEIDLSQFGNPVEKLEDQGMALRALATFNQFIVDKSGVGIGFLYQDLNETCLSELQRQYQREKETKERTELDATIYEPASLSKRVEERQEKIKSRPAEVSTYGMTPTPNTAITVPTSSILKVSPSALEVFTAIFEPSDSGSPIKWASFLSAMSELKFSTASRFGALYTFRPQTDNIANRPVTCIRPLQPAIEGYRLLFVARRLKTRYGWSMESFELAQE